MNPHDKEGALINAIRKRVLLYNTRHVDFKDLRKKERAWISVGEEVGISAPQARRHWTLVRDNFMRYHRRRKKMEEDGLGIPTAQYLSQYQNLLWYLDFCTTKPRTPQKVEANSSDNIMHLSMGDASMTLGGTEEIYVEQPSCTSSGQFAMPVETQIEASEEEEEEELEEDEEEEEERVSACEPRPSEPKKTCTSKDTPFRGQNSNSFRGSSSRREEMDELMMKCMGTLNRAVRSDELSVAESKTSSFLSYLQQLMKTVKPELQDELERGILEFVFSFKKKYSGC